MWRRTFPAGLIALAGIVALMIPRGSAAPPSLQGTRLPARAAPAFHLRDQFGRATSLREFRGRPIVLTFLAASCKEVCPLVAEKLHRVTTTLARAGRKITLVAISTDPEHDTPSTVRSFSQKHGLYHRWHYLSGTRKQLSAIWRSYYVYAAPAGAPKKLRDAHTAATYLIDPSGRERVLMGGDPDATVLERDLKILLGLPVGAVVSRVPAPEVGHPAPALNLASLKHGALQLSAFRGKVVLVNFWATWCGPCRSETRRLQNFYARFSRRGVVVLGVDDQDTASNAVEYVHQHGLTYPIAFDGDGAVSARYDVSALPKSLLIDRSGTIRGVRLGIVDSGFLSNVVKPLLDPPGASR